MRKIPTVFTRDELNRSRITDTVTPGCEWVLAGEGTATRKYDGTCVMFDGQAWWARRQLKPYGIGGLGYVPVEVDPVTGKTVGWEPIAQSAFRKAWREAVVSEDFTPGTYELIGPKINQNPEGVEHHTLVPHARAEVVHLPHDLTPASIRDAVENQATAGWEGIVWHHETDGRMAKVKARDYGFTVAAPS